MFRAIAKKTSLCARIANWSKSGNAGQGSALANAATIAHAVHTREANGEVTTLRQLHKITQLSQREALKAVSDLEKSNMLTVRQNLADALESELQLSEEMRRNLDQVDRRSAA